ncbi:hypothetical protein Xoosp13_217 [Xanthomonas phage Xoo-sp13]|nr:hypothetical protein Xoosp13_217 [Xanthomonas phage Xoo-sp13]
MGLVNIDDTGKRAGVTDAGQETLVNNNLIDDTGQLTDEGTSMIDQTDTVKDEFKNATESVKYSVLKTLI